MEKIRLKYLTKEPLQYGINIEAKHYKDSGIRFLRTTDINNDGEILKEGIYLDKNIVPENYLLKKGDIIFSRSGTIGRAYFHKTDEPMTYAGFLVRFRLEDVGLAKWVYYYSKTPEFKQVLHSEAIESTIQNFNGQKYNNLAIPINHLQLNINHYLDSQSKKIKHFIKKKQTFIALLKEQRQAVINEAVTKGMNQSVKLKNSGIDWLGDIPEHWKVRKLRYCGQCQNGLNKGGEFFGSGFPFFGYGDIYNNEILPETPSGLVQSSEDDHKNCSVQKGDVFFTRTSETVDEIAIASTCHKTISNATFSGFLIRFRPIKDILFDGFSTYYFRCELLRDYFVKEMNIITRASMSQDLLKSLSIVLPPMNEQIRIANYIKTETAKIDQAIAKAQKEIALIKEYKEAMIAEAVLGKFNHKIVKS